MKITTKTQLALNHLRTGVIAHPTDTIYGLACMANNPEAIKTLASLKHRDIKKGFILLASDINYLLPYIDSNLDIDLLTKLSTPTEIATTYLVPKSSISIPTSSETLRPHEYSNSIIRTALSSLKLPTFKFIILLKSSKSIVFGRARSILGV